ncbi:MAG: RDD family protein, partial [Porphyrobacter sp.]|nr:RDD family protein [Porphyrobacter sp.]
GDIIAGTCVVEAPRAALAAVLAGAPGANKATPTDRSHVRFTAAELGVYGIRELQVLERLLREGDAAALATVHRTIAAKIGRTAEDGEERAFLEAFYAALRDKLEKDMRFGKRKTDKFS